MFSSPRRGVTHLSDGPLHRGMVGGERVQRLADVRVCQGESPSHGTKPVSAMHWIPQPSMDIGRHAIQCQCGPNGYALPLQ